MREAVLKSLDGSIEVRIILFPSNESNWMNYILRVSDKMQEPDNKKVELSLLNQDTNYLQLFPENEVEKLVEGIEAVTSTTGQSLVFTPVDEKEFILEIEDSNDDRNKVISLFVTNEDNSNYRGVRFKASVEALTAFRDQLI